MWVDTGTLRAKKTACWYNTKTAAWQIVLLELNTKRGAAPLPVSPLVAAY